MTWRSLLIQNGGKLSLQRRQLLIQQNGESHTVPLEDIAVIIIENRETLITAPLLSALAEYGATLRHVTNSSCPADNGCLMPNITANLKSSSCN